LDLYERFLKRLHTRRALFTYWYRIASLHRSGFAHRTSPAETLPNGLRTAANATRTDYVVRFESTFTLSFIFGDSGMNIGTNNDIQPWQPSRGLPMLRVATR
jgi:hypothetical protein